MHAPDLHDLAIRIYEQEDSVDWIDAMKRCVEHPEVVYDYVIRLVQDVNCDGLRLFVKPEPMSVKRVGQETNRDRSEGRLATWRH